MHIGCAMLAGGEGAKRATEWKWKTDLNFVRYVVLLRVTPSGQGFHIKCLPLLSHLSSPMLPIFLKYLFRVIKCVE